MVPLAALTTLSLLGYHLTFDAEMTQPADMSQFINTFANGDTRLYENHEQQNYVPYDPTNPAKPYVFANGTVTINASPIPAGDQPYTSGLLNTAGIFTQSGGYFEMRAAMPAGQGFWQAFWMLPAAYYPEIDILEQPNNSGTDTEYWTHTSTPTDNTGGFTNTGVNVFSGFHTYGFLWTATSIQYVFDGTLVGSPHTLPPSMVNLPMYLLANVAVGDQYSWPGAPLPGAASSMTIDYIRFFSNDPTVPAVALAPISSPDGVDTTPVLSPPVPVTPAPIGAGPDTLVLQMAEDAYLGDAQFTVSIDGHQRGGILTTTALHTYAQTQAFTILGTFGKSKHTVTVNFLNDASGADGDRNLYVTGATINGAVVHDAVLNEYGSGPQSFGFSGAVLLPVTIGTGPDSFVVGLSEDKNLVNAKYTIAVDGVKQGTSRIVSALHGYGQLQTLIVNGSFGPAAHSVAISLTNGAPAGKPSDGVNLYVDGVSYNAIAAQNASAALTADGTITVQTAAQQPDNLVIGLTEDAYLGDAQASISLDGKLLGTPVVTASNAALGNGGAPQMQTYTGKFGGGAVPHTVVVSFTNDAYVGPGMDRNLYVQGITFNGITVAGRQALRVGGPVTFTYVVPAQ